MAHFIETKRLYIDIPTLSDVVNWQTIHSDQETMQYLGGVRDVTTTQEWLQEDIAHYNKHGFCLGSVFEKESLSFIGRAGLVYLNYDATQQDIEIGYELKKSFWNKGYATELVQTIIAWGFANLTIKRLVAVTKPHNHKSQQVLKKANMQFEKTMTFHGDDYLFYVVYK